ncbi:non-ribosomal peptide synthetase [Natronosporangium hydrolyticum]|uniref:Non-ribosomal peptide synthetase n=1 Tax=Natronosporangium hydrolyticum TaxID=2811111 RepID=A0A895YJW9_9ACTN|nr:non-ribosomal peptide synthetase [Natronosporangium hydrolyticum]QSB16305.1 non-ribosomal peptide synthetase [Natronosporangium hydrolyticum]
MRARLGLEVLVQAWHTAANGAPVGAATVVESGRMPATPIHFPYRDATLGAAFADVARRYPGRPAVLGPDRSVTYQELAAAAGGIAERLRAIETGHPADRPVDVSGADPRGPALAGRFDLAPRVGLLLSHGEPMIAAILGGLAAGWCYVPLDPTYPPERLRVMAAQSGLSAIVTHSSLRELAAAVAEPVPGAVVIELDEVAPGPLEITEVAAEQPAYILFTSGSTGRPKGVTHGHRSVLHGLGNHIENFALRPADRTSLVTPFSYDMSVSDLYGALLAGAAVAPVDLRRDGLARLADALARARVTIYHSTPTVFRYLVDYLIETGGPEHRLPDVRTVLLGGEPATRDDLNLVRRHFAPDCRLVNGYGATEVSFTVQLHLPVGAEPPGDPGSQVLPIGTPLAGYQPVLLDGAGQPMPETESGPGELAIRSDYLALGYWGEPTQTAERFLDSGRLYRTGDLAERLPDGTLCYRGRVDRQVKVNGHRVELGEVEAQLAALPGVARAVAVARPAATAGPAGGVQLYGYVQPARGVATEALDPARLRTDLAAQLPSALLPHRVVVVPALPLTISGKVDVRALPDPTAVPAPVPVQSRPVGRTEDLVARAWCDVLGVAAVGRQVTFFDAGGDSLSLNRLQYRLTAVTGVTVPLVRLLEYPTVAAMAAHLDSGATAGARSSVVDDAAAAPEVSALDAVAGRMAQRRGARRARSEQERQRGRNGRWIGDRR